MSVRYALLPVLSISLLLAACGEDKNPAGPAAGDTKSRLIAAKWKQTAHTVSPAVDLDGDGVMVTDLQAAMGPCIADDVTAFKADGTWTLDEGAVKCDPSDPQTESGTWTLSADQKTFTMTNPDPDLAFTLTLTVVEATATTLKFSTPGDWDDGVAHTEILTFTAQ
jgi:hypothetical protein